jgi:ribosome-associated translation inhibitor RaiA
MSINSVDIDRTTMVVQEDEPHNDPHAEVVVKGRNVEIPDHFRTYVSEKLARLERFDRSIYAALESAVSKLENRLRRSKDRRKIHYGDKTPVSLAEATAISVPPLAIPTQADEDNLAPEDHEPGRIVRTKEHTATPMKVDDALYEMELVGHDFFLFHDEESDKPTVVYRRHAYDYGLIRLS